MVRTFIRHESLSPPTTGASSLGEHEMVSRGLTMNSEVAVVARESGELPCSQS